MVYMYAFDRMKVFLGSVAVAALLSGCSLDVDSQFSQEPITLHHDVEAQTFAQEEFSVGQVQAIADHYKRYGNGPLNITVAYDPSSRHKTAMWTTDKLGEIVSLFAMKDVRSVATDIMPARGVEGGAQVLIGYQTVSAEPPKDCTLMGGMGDREVYPHEDYKYGCSISTQLVRQVYSPKDLAGNDVNPDVGGARRAVSSVLNYKYAVPNEPLEGESVTTSD